jgi:hypothetical protein
MRPVMGGIELNLCLLFQTDLSVYWALLSVTKQRQTVIAEM